MQVGEKMKTINQNLKNEIEINHSRFICLLYHVHDLNEVNTYLTEAKKDYPQATHYCYAYIVANNQKASDDGEPGGTAGIPIMEVLLKNDLNYVLCLVIRYFGGIKLGAGGLVRAYSKAVSNTLNPSAIVTLTPGYEISFSCQYAEQKKYDFLLKDYYVQKHFDTEVHYLVKIPQNKINILANVDFKIINNIFITIE